LKNKELSIELLSTEHCHLCDSAEAIISPLAVEAGLDLIKVDIADDDALFESYGTSIPVLRRIDTPDLCWPFDEAACRAWLMIGAG
jgi:hypothetical protein